MANPKVRILMNHAGRPYGVEVDGVRLGFLNSISIEASVESGGMWEVKLGASIATDNVEIVNP